MTAMIDSSIEVIVGVDTHADSHTAVALNGLGQRLGSIEVLVTPQGFEDLVGWASSHGVLGRVGVEGTGCYGAGLCRFLQAEGLEVLEVDRPNRQRRRRNGKSDTADAEAAARAVLAGEATTIPKDRTGTVEAIRMLHIARRSAIKAQVAAVNQIKDIVVTAPEPIRAELAPLNGRQRVKVCVNYQPEDLTDPASAARTTLASLARRWLDLKAEIAELETARHKLLKELVPTLLNEYGVGDNVAAELVIAAGQNPDRFRTEAAFAALCGTSPVDASSGKQQHHRLNQGGNRQANAALYTTAIVRSRAHPETLTYIAKAKAKGRTDRHIRRCLKRALARRFHNIIKHDLNNHPLT